MIRTAGLIAACLGLAGCASGSVGSIQGGECKIVKVPPYVVLGKTGYDQRWINVTTESIVVGCRQPRPQARPASLDAPPPPVATAKTPAERKRLRDRMRRWLGS